MFYEQAWSCSWSAFIKREWKRKIKASFAVWVSWPSLEKYCRSSCSCAPAERLRMLMAAASVMAPPNPLTLWYFWKGTMVNLRPDTDSSGHSDTSRTATLSWPLVLTWSRAVRLDLNLTLAGLQSAALHAAQVGGVLTQWGQRYRPEAVTVGRVTLTHHRAGAKVPGNTSTASWEEGHTAERKVLFLHDRSLQLIELGPNCHLNRGSVLLRWWQEPGEHTKTPFYLSADKTETNNF